MSKVIPKIGEYYNGERVLEIHVGMDYVSNDQLLPSVTILTEKAVYVIPEEDLDDTATKV